MLMCELGFSLHKLKLGSDIFLAVSRKNMAIVEFRFMTQILDGGSKSSVAIGRWARLKILLSS